jgi:hypothetical protein
VVAVALLLALAGCGAGGGSSTPTPAAGPDPGTLASETPTTGTATATATDAAGTAGAATPTTTDAAGTATRTPTTPVATNASDYAIPVVGNGSIPFDVNRTYARTVELLRAPVGPPAQVSLYTSPNPYRPVVREPFAAVLLNARRSSNLTIPRREGVVMKSEGKRPLGMRYTLAHEFTHNVQFARTEGTAVRRAVFYADDHQRRRVAAAIMEGSASYTALRQVLKYTDHDRSAVLSRVDEYRNASPAGKYVWAPYHFGRQYVAARVDSPAEHWRLYGNPPETAEELIHGLAPGSEPPKPLSVRVEAGEWSVEERERRGEMFLRVVLAAELSEPRAAAGAAGWGNDELLTIETASGTGYAWAIRWDSPEEAAEFRGALRVAMDRRADRRGGVWTANGTAIDLRQASDGTTVVFAGDPSFVTGATASAAGGNVTVGKR